MGRDFAPWLVGIGLVIVALGVLAWTGALSWFGRLPGDIRVQTEHTRIYVPIVSMLLISLVLNLVIWLLRR